MIDELDLLQQSGDPARVAPGPGSAPKLAEQLRNTYSEEKRAEDERIKTERARATADNDKQDDLVRAEIVVQVGEQTEAKAAKRGRGREAQAERDRGQRAQTDVQPGPAAPARLMKKVLAAAQDNPELVEVPTVRVQDEDAESRALLSALSRVFPMAPSRAARRVLAHER